MWLNLIKKPTFLGLAAGIVLLGLYLSILTLANSFSHALSQFSQLWYWILILVIGFGIQIGLYFYIRESFRSKQMKSPTAVVATSGGASAGSMIACCLHHLVDVLPIMGLAAASLFLIKYQTLFLVIGILSNLIGITIMLEIIQKNNLAKGFLKKISVFNMSQVKKIIVVLSLLVISITFLLSGKPKNQPEPKFIKDFPVTLSEQAGISFEVKPLDFNFNDPVKFEIKITTHTGSLDFDLIKISILEDDEGNQYQPLDWQGSPPGGHHREGILAFDKLKEKSKSIRLIIKDGLSPRIFEWDLE